MSAYAEFAVTTNFTFLRGASHPEEMVAQAMALGLDGIGIADRNSLAGVVRAHLYARDNEALAKGLRVFTGARLSFCDGTPDILAYPKDRAAYGRLSRLLTRGNLRAEKGSCRLTFEDLADHAEGLQLAILPAFETQPMRIADIAALARGRVWIAAAMTYGRRMRRNLLDMRQLAQAHGLPLLATNDVHMHDSARRPLADVLTCVREGVTIDTAGTRLAANAERHLKTPREMARLFRDAPEAIAQTQRFMAGIDFSLDQLAYEYPDELREGFGSEQEALEHFAWEGAAFRYPHGVPAKIAATIRHELALVAQMRYAAYFLTVHDIVRFARKRGILCQGRGSAANSTVCFCLGITEVDPTKHDLLFERFISPERKEPPDIDVDFEHERREEVMQYIYARYGRLRAGLTATVISYRARSAIRDVGKAFGFSEDSVAALSGTVWGWWSGAVDDAEIRRIGFDPDEPRLKQAVAIADELTGFPRHLSQHTGGFVITRERLDEVVPIANAAMADRTTVEWDKDDLDALGIPQDRRSRARHAELPAQGIRTAARALRARSHAGDAALRRALRLRDDFARRHDRRVPDRKPRADVDAAAAEAGEILRSRHRGGDRAARPHPGRHGASLSAAAAEARAGHVSVGGTRRGARQDARACRCSRNRR